MLFFCVWMENAHEFYTTWTYVFSKTEWTFMTNVYNLK